MIVIEGIVIIMSWFVDLVEKYTPWRFDEHQKPHMVTKAGGCACICDRCVRCFDCRNEVVHTLCYFRCICRRCNEECPSIGRLGAADAVYIEREYGAPEGGVKGWSWYRKW